MTDGQLTGSEDQVLTTSQEEQMIPQSKVGKIAKGAKEEGYAKGYQAAMAELNNQQQSQSAQQVPQQQYQPPGLQQSMGGVPQFTPEMEEQMRRIVNEQTAEMRRDDLGRQIHNDFMSKMDAASAKYSDFKDVVGPLEKDISANPEVMAKLVIMINGMDNAGDIMYDLAKNPHKVGTLVTLSHTAPNLAQSQLAALSASIKNNHDAQSQVTNVNEPVGQLKPSPAKGADSGSMSAKDLKKMDYLRKW